MYVRSWCQTYSCTDPGRFCGETQLICDLNGVSSDRRSTLSLGSPHLRISYFSLLHLDSISLYSVDSSNTTPLTFYHNLYTMSGPGVGHEFPAQEVSWVKRDVLLFANSIGITSDELHFLYVQRTPFPYTVREQVSNLTSRSSTRTSPSSQPTHSSCVRPLKPPRPTP